MDKGIIDLNQPELNQFQEELAKTYFSPAPSKENHLTKPTSERQKRPHIFIGIILTLIAALVAALFILNKIEINIKVIPSSGINQLSDRQPPDIIYLSKNGELNTDVVKNIMFYENSDIESNWGKESILLSNEEGTKKAALGIDFTRPLNLKENLLYFYSRGKRGGEDLRICLKDANDNICYSKINELQNSWQQFIMNADQAKDYIDSENITHIDLEVNSTVYFKDFYLARRRE